MSFRLADHLSTRLAASRAALRFVIGFAFCLAATFVVASTLRMIYQCWFPAPIEDQWQELIGGRQITWAWLIAQHNEHRILLPRLVFILDCWISRERNIVELVFNVAIQISITISFPWIISRDVKLVFLRCVPLAAFVTCLTFWSIQWENLTSGFQVQFLGVTLGAIVTFCLIALATPSRTNLALIVLSIGCTTFTLASGFLAGVIAIPLSILARRSRRDSVVIAIATLVFFFCYIDGYRQIMHDPDGLVSFARLSKTIVHAVTDLGGPFGEGANTVFGWDGISVALIMGSAGLLVYIAVAWIVVRTYRSLAALTLLSVASFAVLAACVTASGRALFGLTQALSSRYTSPMLAFWVAISFLIYILGARPKRLPAIVTWGLPIGLVLLAVSSEGAFVQTARQSMEPRFAALPGLAARVMDVPRLQPIQNDPHETFTYLDRMMLTRTSLYAEAWLRWKGTQLTDHVTMSDASACSGSIVSREAAGSPPFVGFYFSGNVQTERRIGQVRIIMTDQGGSVTGFGVVSPLALAAAGIGPAVWSGYVAGDRPADIRPYVFVSKTVVCPLTPMNGSQSRSEG